MTTTPGPVGRPRETVTPDVSECSRMPLSCLPTSAATSACPASWAVVMPRRTLGQVAGSDSRGAARQHPSPARTTGRARAAGDVASVPDLGRARPRQPARAGRPAPRRRPRSRPCSSTGAEVSTRPLTRAIGSAPASARAREPGGLEEAPGRAPVSPATCTTARPRRVRQRSRHEPGGRPTGPPRPSPTRSAARASSLRWRPAEDVQRRSGRAARRLSRSAPGAPRRRGGDRRRSGVPASRGSTGEHARAVSVRARRPGRRSRALEVEGSGGVAELEEVHRLPAQPCRSGQHVVDERRRPRRVAGPSGSATVGSEKWAG